MLRLVQGSCPISIKTGQEYSFEKNGILQSPVTVAPQPHSLFPEVYCASLEPVKKTKQLVG